MTRGGESVRALPAVAEAAIEGLWRDVFVRSPEQRFVARWVQTELISLTICEYHGEAPAPVRATRGTVAVGEQGAAARG